MITGKTLGGIARETFRETQDFDAVAEAVAKVVAERCAQLAKVGKSLGYDHDEIAEFIGTFPWSANCVIEARTEKSEGLGAMPEYKDCYIDKETDDGDVGRNMAELYKGHLIHFERDADNNGCFYVNMAGPRVCFGWQHEARAYIDYVTKPQHNAHVLEFQINRMAINRHLPFSRFFRI